MKNYDIKKIRMNGKEKVVTIDAKNKDLAVGDFVIIRKISPGENAEAKVPYKLTYGCDNSMLGNYKGSQEDIHKMEGAQG